METLKKYTGVLVLGAAFVLLAAGIWGPGLWDPWEMNRAHLARKMAESPRVLVMEVRQAAGVESIASMLTRDLSDDATVVPATEGAPSESAPPIELGRTMLSDHVFRAAVVDIDTKMKTPGDRDGTRALSDILGAVVPQNLSTMFLLVSSSGANDTNAIREAILSQARGRSGDEAESAADAIETRVTALASRADLTAAVRSSLALDAFTAQFKSGGRTQFTPPLDAFILSLSFRALGMTEFAARLPGVIMATLVLCLVYLAVGRAFGRKEAVLSVAVALSCPLFFESARFVGNELSTMLFLACGVVAQGAFLRGWGRWKAIAAIAASILALYLSGGLTAVFMLVAVLAAYPIVTWDWRTESWTGAAVACGLALLLLLVTFLPEGAFFRQFRFTGATFAGGMPLTERSFDFGIKQVGFGLFPWSALLPLAVMGVMAGERQKRPETFLALLAAVAPFVLLMVVVRPFQHYLYAGVPALATLVALYLARAEDDAVESRALAFFGLGLFAVMAKDIFRSPEALVSFLATDPTFSEPGKGDLVFPGVSLGGAAKAFIALAGIALMIGGGRLVSFARSLPAVFARGRTFWYVLAALAGLIVLDIVVFVGLKWDILSGAAGPDVALGAVILRIFLTGPDIALLYLLLLASLVIRFAPALHEFALRFVQAPVLGAVGRAILAIERPWATFAVMGASAAGLFAIGGYWLQPELSFHLSQKHIIQTYQESSAKAPGDLFRHGVFAGRGNEDVNFYTGQVREMNGRSDVVERLKDTSKRTFFIVPKSQWSEIDSAFRTASGGRHAPVLDDRSSRFILVASSLAQGEEDANWLARATLTEAEFNALPDIVRENVNFDDRIRLVGYSLDSAAVRRGGTATIRMYFRCVDKVPVSYRIFMHIDRVGSSSRIHGDHWILNLVKETEEQTSCVGCFATTHWLKGDIVIDTYPIEVPIGSPSGPHDIWMGFYSPGDDKRLKVKDFDKDKIRHDGQNRVRIGVLTVE